MYAVKVNVKQSPEDAELSEEASRLATELLAEQSLDTAGSSDHIQDAVSFSAGNPRVEHLTGKVHLYRQVSSDAFSHQRPQLPVSFAAILQLAQGRQTYGRLDAACLPYVFSG